MYVKTLIMYTNSKYVENPSLNVSVLFPKAIYYIIKPTYPLLAYKGVKEEGIGEDKVCASY